MDHYELEPVEVLVEALADLETLTHDVAFDPLVSTSPSWFVERVAATSEVEFFAHALATGETHKLDPEMLTGRGAFWAMLSVSALVFMDPFEPFGRVWSNPRLSQVRDWVQHWRYCHRLDDSFDEIEGFIRQLHEDDADDLIVHTPIYMVTLRKSDLIRAEALARTFHQRRTDGEIGPLPRSFSVREHDRPEEEPPGCVILTSADVAKKVKLTKQTIRVWRTEGKGPPYYKTGSARSSRVYYLLDEVDEWIRNNKR